MCYNENSKCEALYFKLKNREKRRSIDSFLYDSVVSMQDIGAQVDIYILFFQPIQTVLRGATWT